MHSAVASYESQSLACPALHTIGRPFYHAARSCCCIVIFMHACSAHCCIWHLCNVMPYLVVPSHWGT